MSFYLLINGDPLEDDGGIPISFPSWRSADAEASYVECTFPWCNVTVREIN